MLQLYSSAHVEQIVIFSLGEIHVREYPFFRESHTLIKFDGIAVLSSCYQRDLRRDAVVPAEIDQLLHDIGTDAISLIFLRNDYPEFSNMSALDLVR